MIDNPPEVVMGDTDTIREDAFLSVEPMVEAYEGSGFGKDGMVSSALRSLPKSTGSKIIEWSTVKEAIRTIARHVVDEMNHSSKDSS
jgi:hypothetical protein